MLSRWPKNACFSCRNVFSISWSYSLHTGAVCTKDDSPRNHYHVLGVGKNATKPEIRSAYVTLSKRYHPDSHQRDSGSGSDSQAFVRVSEAYRVLSSPQRRAQYDRELAVAQAYRDSLYTSSGAGGVYGSSGGSQSAGNKYDRYSPGRGAREGEFYKFDDSNIDWEMYKRSNRKPNHSKVLFLLLGLTVTVPAIFMLRVNNNYHKYYQSATFLKSQRNTEAYNAVREKAKNSTVQEQLELLVARHTANPSNNDDDSS